MPAGFAFALLLAAGQTAPDGSATTTEDIVVVARRGDSCEVRYADKTMTDAELRAHTRSWAQGTPVRVMARSNADLACLKKIAFKLAAQGVKRMEFVDPSGKPALDAIPNAEAPPHISDTPQFSGGEDAVRNSERSFIARRAARLILQGDCAGARKLALEAEDLQTAAYVAQICASR